MNVGGPAIQISGLMRSLPLESFEQKLVTGFCDENEADYLEINELKLSHTKIYGFGRSVNIFSDLKVLFAIRREIKAFKPHIIHTHTAKAGFLGRIASLSILEKQIRVHTFHGHLLHGYFGKFKTRLVILTERILAHFTDKFVAVGEQVRDELLAVKIGTYDKYDVIGPGLELAEMPSRKTSREHFRIAEDEFVVTWIGRAVPVKAPHRIIEIAKECQSRDLKVRFVVVGDGPLSSELRGLSEHLELPITYLGWQSEIERVLSISDVVLLTSENEGTPVVLIQAQMAGIPVITTDVGSASEVMINERTGFCLKYSAREFSDKIEILIEDSVMRSSFGAAGKSNALEKFSLNRLVSDHGKLYRGLISQSKS
jgi:glycosyltransferase involved in cell wall biosynthesis